MSKIRKAYFARLVGRVITLLCVIAIFIYKPEWLVVLQRGSFFSMFSPLHILWVLWIMDMILQLTPVKENIPLGSQKLFRHHFRPIREKINHESLRNYIISTTKAAYKVFILWGAIAIILGFLFHLGLIPTSYLFLISVIFYVCDLICVLIWCPFRLIMKNRCCTTCRIFNWDHLMMFTPMLFINSFFSASLLIFAFAVWVVWELSIMMYPERFWEHSNAALKCSECTDKLCTQYCRKLRK